MAVIGSGKLRGILALADLFKSLWRAETTIR
jgi:hypothetical protein